VSSALYTTPHAAEFLDNAIARNGLADLLVFEYLPFHAIRIGEFSDPGAT
jgi:hypothetical protein